MHFPTITRANDDELTLQLLGIRLFNAAGAALKLALSGYYQKGFDARRDILETGFLVDYLTTFPEKIAEWKAANKRTRIARGEDVPTHEFSAVLFSIFAGPFGDYHRALVFA
jgi:hypothetical protein